MNIQYLSLFLLLYDLFKLAVTYFKIWIWFNVFKQQAQNNNAHQGHPSPPTVSSTQHHYGTINSPIKVPQVSSSTGGPDSTFTVPDDVGMGFEGGVRVLQSLGNWWVKLYLIQNLLYRYKLPFFILGWPLIPYLPSLRSPEVTNNIPRPNLIPFTEPYAEGGSMHPGTRLKALQGTTIRKHPAIKPTSSTNEGRKTSQLPIFYISKNQDKQMAHLMLSGNLCL